MSDDVVAAVRAFNRFYTRQVGLLNEYVAMNRFSLAEGRVLYELSKLGQSRGMDLAQALDMDPAYLSRLLRKFVAAGLVVPPPSLTDRRSTQTARTREGDAAVAEREDLNDDAIDAMLDQVVPAEREARVAAMATIRAILGDEPKRS